MILGSALAPLEAIARPIEIRATHEKIFHTLDEFQKNPPQSEQTPVITKIAPKIDEAHIRDYLTKIRNPDRYHHDDIILDTRGRQLLESVVKRLRRLQSTVGHGNFCVFDFDASIHAAKRYSRVGAFTRDELDFLEETFFRDAKEYGFMGDKQINKLTAGINQRDFSKIPYTGNYLFKGESQRKYAELQKRIGKELILTSGIRGITKQFYLFLNKAYTYNGNLSLASRSLAPPGYSFHATGDFDVGQRGFGGGNFSVKFTSTPVFHSLTRKGYVEYRYEKDNMLGVRYEPWHIKL